MKNRFTLIELLAVMVIMGVIMAITLPSLSHFTLAQKFNTAATTVKSSLLLARTHAMSQRKTVAMVFPTANNEIGFCYVNAWDSSASPPSFTYQGPIHNTTVISLPEVGIVDKLEYFDETTGEWKTGCCQVSGIRWEEMRKGSTNEPVCRAVVFKSNGSLAKGKGCMADQNERPLHIIVANMVRTGNTTTKKSDALWEITLNAFTGSTMRMSDHVTPASEM